MKSTAGIILFVVALTMGCGHQTNTLQPIRMEMKSDEAHFPDMDTNGNELVSWTEFKNHFPDAEKSVFYSCDLSNVRLGSCIQRKW